MHGLDLYDYGARQYDAVVPMFTQQDPMAEKYYHLSPYAYCGSNPIRYTDPTGMKFDLSDMDDEQEKQYYDAINALRNSSPLFSTIYNSLESSENIYSISLGNPQSSSNNIDVDGQFTTIGTGGSIVFSKDKIMGNGINNTVYAEEFFHAYQHENSSNYSQGSFNREFEAKTFATVVGYETTGFGGYKGMIEFQNSIMEGKYGDVNHILTPQTVDSPVFISDYLSHANSYGEYNRMNKIGNINYHVPTTVIPYSLINVVKRSY